MFNIIFFVAMKKWKKYAFFKSLKKIKFSRVGVGLRDLSPLKAGLSVQFYPYIV